MKPITRTIRGKMIGLIAVPTLVIYVVMLGLMMVHLRGEARRDIERQMTRLAGNFAARFDGAFREAAAIATATARFMETRPDLSEAEIFAQLSANTLQNPVIYGAAMAFEPGMFPSDEPRFCPYVYRGSDGLVEMNIGIDVLDWYGDEKWQWWHIPKRTGHGAWTDPYFDEGAGNVLMVTYGAPFLRDGVIRGVTTVDIMLPTLQESMGQQILGDLAFAILTARGQFVFSPHPEYIMTRTVFEVYEERNRPDIVEAAERIISGASGVVALDGWDTPEKQWVFYAPIASTGWGFAAIITERDALAGVRARMTEAGLSMAVTLVLIIALIWFVSGRLARPIAKLRTKVLQIAGGDLDARVEEVTSRDEIGELATSFNQMTADLRSHVDRLAEEQAAREKIERDLDLAREIQRGLLPTQEPKTPGFEISGWNQAADKTGGDYFDWLELPDGRTIVTLADVTGHGIGPALIVAVCRAYMRAAASTGGVNLGEALGRVNDLLHGDIPSNRFVTAVVGIIDPKTGRMSLASAGQAPILFYEASTGTVHNWDADDLPLGVMGGLSFEGNRDIDFGSGDVLVLTTDGFFEWANPENEQYGTKRLIEFVQSNHGRTPEEFIGALHEAVLAHAAGTAQGDDLTAVVIKKT
jgi:sigma-B regulation protein RsbU (phosphoserine phosphatase)